MATGKAVDKNVEDDGKKERRAGNGQEGDID
jgi:hypothetical protein